MTSPIYIITGIMASGKSTVAEALAGRFPRSVHIRGDAFRRFIVNGQAEMNGESLSAEAVKQLHLRQELAADAARKYAAEGYTVVLQDILLGPDLEAMANRFADFEAHVIVLCPSAKSVAARDAHRRETRGKIAYAEGGLTPETMDAILRESTPRIGLWLDTSELTVEQTVDEILRRYGDSALSRQSNP